MHGTIYDQVKGNNIEFMIYECWGQGCTVIASVLILDTTT